MIRNSLAALTSLLAFLLVAPSVSGQTPPQFVGGPPGPGVNFAVYSGGPVEDLPIAAPDASAFFATVDGQFVSYRVGAPSFVNNQFSSHFADGIPANTPLIVLTPTEPAPIGPPTATNPAAARTTLGEFQARLRALENSVVSPPFPGLANGGFDNEVYREAAQDAARKLPEFDAILTEVAEFDVSSLGLGCGAAHEAVTAYGEAARTYVWDFSRPTLFNAGGIADRTLKGRADRAHGIASEQLTYCSDAYVAVAPPPPATVPNGSFVVDSFSVTYNVLGNPEASVSVENISDVEITAFEVLICAFNAFGEPVPRYGSGTNCFIGVSNSSVEPYHAKGGLWTLFGQETATRITVTPHRSALKGGGVWTP